jgi:hypothetical protein
MSEEQEFARVLQSLSTQARARASALDLMTHTLRHMEIYIEVLGDKLAQNGLLKEATVQRLEASMSVAQQEIEDLDHSLQTCSWTPHEMAELIETRGRGPVAEALIERYREQGCWSDAKRFQIGRVFEATVRKWWGEQKRAIKEAAHVSLHDDLDNLFASHYPASKQYWRMNTETYRERVEAAAERLFPHSASLVSTTTAALWKATSSLFVSFKHVVTTSVTHLVRLLRRHWKVALVASAILAMTLAAVTFVPLAVASAALTSAAAGYQTAMVAIAPFCPLFYTVEALVGVSYVLRMLLGVKSSPVSQLADQAYVYKSETLEQMMLSLDRSDVIQGWRQVLATRFHYKLTHNSEESDAHNNKLEKLVLGDNKTSTGDNALRILYQCIYWANFALSFACASSMNTAQANLGHVDRARDIGSKVKASSSRVQRLVDHCRDVGTRALAQCNSTIPIATTWVWTAPPAEVQDTLSDFVSGMATLTTRIKGD